MYKHVDSKADYGRFLEHVSQLYKLTIAETLAKRQEKRNESTGIQWSKTNSLRVF